MTVKAIFKIINKTAERVSDLTLNMGQKALKAL